MGGATGASAIGGGTAGGTTGADKDEGLPRPARAGFTASGGTTSSGTSGPDPAAPNPSSNSAAPEWANRMRQAQSLSHSVQSTAHVVRSGDSHGGGSALNLSESDR